MWLSDRGCSDIVEAVWLSREDGEVHDHVIRKIEKCGKELRVWNRDCFGNVKLVLRQKRKELKEAKKVAMRSGNNQQVRDLKKDIAELVDKENRLWFQRSKVMWAKFGDRNSKYFHSQASQRKRKNLIRRLKDSNGRVIEDNEGIAECLVHYYQSLLSSENQQFCTSATDSIQTVITEEMNAKLSSEFTLSEVKQVINQMAPLKAPRPDAFESLHSMQRHTGKEGYMAIKLDMSKAYDRVKWAYLQSVVEKLGFTDHWIKLMMLCVKTVTYSLLVNGEPKGMITPTRGIRQGDPLSPFLFLLCTEGLNGLLNKAANQGHIKGYSLCRNSPRLTHLLFADDSLLFCRATIEECQRVLDILDVYRKCSGQQINRSKTLQ
nr:uncharacterized protein LOC111990594 [Quercus suber]